jgi:hypothetical protein
MPNTRVAAQPEPATTMRAALAQQIAPGSQLRAAYAAVEADRTGAAPTNVTQCAAQIARLQQENKLLGRALLQLARLVAGVLDAAD